MESTEGSLKKGKIFVESILKEYGNLSLEEYTKKIDENRATNFSNITDCREMLSYLRDINNRIKSRKVLCHYTSIKVSAQ